MTLDDPPGTCNAPRMADETPAKKKAPAGWYDDPKLVNTRRYWDGAKWTDQRIEKSPPTTAKASAGGGLARASIALIGLVIIVALAFLVKGLFFAKFDVHGTLSLTGSDNFTTMGTLCYGDGGYDDIHSGASVVIKDSDGKSVGLGELRSPVAAGGICTFSFVVDGVDAGGDLYSVEVSHRGGVSFRKDEADTISLSIGD